MEENTTAGSTQGAPESTPGRTEKRTYRKSAASSSASRANLVSAWEARKKAALGKMVTLKIPPELLAQIDIHTEQKIPRWKVVKAGLNALDRAQNNRAKKV